MSGTTQTVVIEVDRFRVVARGNQIELQVRSGRLGGPDEWYKATYLGEYLGFVEQLGKTLTQVPALWASEKLTQGK